MLHALRQRIARLERTGAATVGAAADTARLTFGLAAIDDHLPDGGLAAAAIHEILDGDADATAIAPSGRPALAGAAATAFVAALAGRRQQTGGRTVVWIAPRHGPHESLYRHGLAPFGLDPEALLVVRIPGSGRAATTRTLWALEECLRERTVALACAELGTLDLTASRRLQLAAAAGGTTGLLLRGGSSTAALPPTACVTRWRIASAPSPDLGNPHWRVELLRARNGRPHHWLLEWRHDPDLVASSRYAAPRHDPARSAPGERKAAGFALAAALRDRPDLPAQRPSVAAGDGTQRAA
jgi:protein ImuA